MPFNGEGSLETFLAKFENMSRYLEWGESDTQGTGTCALHLKVQLGRFCGMRAHKLIRRVSWTSCIPVLVWSFRQNASKRN